VWASACTGSDIVVDKHCVGGLPGNRTTLIVVPIVAACGLTIPKTSSRAITPAGSADTMETLAPVGWTCPPCGGWWIRGRLHRLGRRRFAESRRRHADPRRAAAGTHSDWLLAVRAVEENRRWFDHVVIDIPVGRTAKVRSPAAAAALAGRLIEVGTALGLAIDVVQSDGSQPVGRGIGPALEAWDVLAVLRNEAGAPEDLRQRAVTLAGRLLELGGKALPGQGVALAMEVLASGADVAQDAGPVRRAGAACASRAAPPRPGDHGPACGQGGGGG
jgi:thymidine phosphorylase